MKFDRAASVAVLILAFIIISVMVIAQLCSIKPTNHEDQTEPVMVGPPEIIDRRISANDTYELLYKTTYSNGLSVCQWQQVDWDDYIRLWEER